ncbi:uncharacterized protein LOC135113755 [Scylla paramamosain]|uniref:uncharacterized protein LOC135113755 n=1 Tax=Scylla paramamosain TaxID=85552 RepID=UPI003083CF45
MAATLGLWVMVYSGLATLSMVEEDLLQSKDEDKGVRPAVTAVSGIRQLPSLVVRYSSLPPPASCHPLAASSSKRLMWTLVKRTCPPASKSSRVGEGGDVYMDFVEWDDSDFLPLLPPCPLLSASPATVLLTWPQPSYSRFHVFMPWLEYAKLRFEGNPGVDVKLRWLAEVDRVFSLDCILAKVRIFVVTCFVYISRKRPDIVQRVMAGEFLALPLVVQDSPKRPHKFPSYLTTCYPVEIDQSLSKKLPVYSAHHFHQKGGRGWRSSCRSQSQDPKHDSCQ